MMKLVVMIPSLAHAACVFRNCKERFDSGTTVSGLVDISPTACNDPVRVFCGENGESSIFTLDTTKIELGNATCFNQTFPVDDSDQILMWQDLTCLMPYIYLGEGDIYLGQPDGEEQLWAQVSRNGSFSAAANLSDFVTLPNFTQVLGVGTPSQRLPIVFPASERTVFYSSMTRQLIWLGQAGALVVVNGSNMPGFMNFTFYDYDYEFLDGESMFVSSDGVDTAVLGCRTRASNNINFSVLLEFNFIEDTVQATKQPLIDALDGDVYSTDDDDTEQKIFHQLFTVNGKTVIFSMTGNKVVEQGVTTGTLYSVEGEVVPQFYALGGLRDTTAPRTLISMFNGTRDNGDASWGWDLFGFVHENGFLFMADQGHDGDENGYFKCPGNPAGVGDSQFGVAQSNIKLTFQQPCPGSPACILTSTPTSATAAPTSATAAPTSATAAPTAATTAAPTGADVFSAASTRDTVAAAFTAAFCTFQF